VCLTAVPLPFAVRLNNNNYKYLDLHERRRLEKENYIMRGFKVCTPDQVIYELSHQEGWDG
jgi:hypothetical protein